MTRVEFFRVPTNRGWTRDFGPIFVKKKHRVATLDCHFNAWAKYNDWQKDRKVPETAARRLRQELFHARFDGKPFVLEGGGIRTEADAKAMVAATAPTCTTMSRTFPCSRPSAP